MTTFNNIENELQEENNVLVSIKYEEKKFQ